MRRSIATVCLSGTLPEKLEAAAAARFDAVEIFENDLLFYDGSPREVRLLRAESGPEGEREHALDALHCPRQRLGPTQVPTHGLDACIEPGPGGIPRQGAHLSPLRQELRHELSIDGKSKKQKFSSRDQVSPEIIYFSDCIREGRMPEPSGEEGLADIRIVRALYESAATGRSVRVEPVRKQRRPDASQEMRVPQHDKPDLVHADSPH